MASQHLLRDIRLKKINNSIKDLNSLLSLSKIPLHLVSSDGVILTELSPPPDFCKCICQKSEGVLCEDYTCYSGTQNDIRFNCRFGLQNFIFPIKIEQDFQLYLVGGQVYNRQAIYKKYMINVDSLAREKNQSRELIAKLVGSIKNMEEDQISFCEQIVKYITLNISESLKSTNIKIAQLSFEKNMLEQKVKDLQMKNSFLVVNPHFVFNTLNTIARIAYFEKSYKTGELIYCLSDLLRYNLKQNDKLHTLQKEIENIKKYLYIQKIRFKNRLNYEINIPPKLETYRIPNMILQPIIENALIHGIMPKHEGGSIRITAKEGIDYVTIKVIDNGQGFPAETLSLLTHSDQLSEPSLSCSKNIGLCSTDRRIKHFFGETYGIYIEKSDSSGSIVGITLPNST